MKKSPFFFFVALVILITAVCTPEVMYASLPKVDYIKITKTDIEKTVSVSGKIASNKENIQTADGIYIISEVLVHVGDYVRKNDKIIKINTEKTEMLYKAKGISYTGSDYITSDFEGTVSNIFAQEEMTTAENIQLISIIDNNDLCAKLYISEDVFSQIKKGQKCNISGSAFGDKTYSAKITNIGEVATQNNGLETAVLATAEFENKDELLKSGFNIKAKITTDTFKNKIIIPSGCVSQDDNGEYVFKLNQNKVNKTYIKIGDITSKGTIVLKGLDENDYIVSNPQSVEKDNSYVSVKE